MAIPPSRFSPEKELVLHFHLPPEIEGGKNSLIEFFIAAVYKPGGGLLLYIYIALALEYAREKCVLHYLGIVRPELCK